MPIIKSAQKRVRVAEKQSIQNAKTKRTLRSRLKAFQQSLSQKKDTTKSQAEAYSAIDTAVKKGVITKNKAARKKSQLNAASKVAGSTKAGSKKSGATKPAPKKSTAKPKTTSKTKSSGTPKVATAKKSAPKKTPAKSKK